MTDLVDSAGSISTPRSEEETHYVMEISCVGCSRPPPPPPQIIWNFFAPHLRQKARVPPNMFDHTMYSERPWGAFDKLARMSEELDDEGRFFLDMDGDEISRSSPLETLPVEILDLVLRELHPTEFVWQLGLCSRGMWNRILGYVLNDRRRFLGYWAGTEILCAAETMEMFPRTLQQLDGREGGEARTWFQRANEDFDELQSFRHWYEIFEGFLEEFEESNYENEECPGEPWHWRVPTTLKSKADALLRGLREPRGCKTWVLRNFTEKKFVRLRLVRDMEEVHDEGRTFVVHVDGIPELSLDLMLLRRICWSGRCEEEVGLKGKWAGHCFDVVRDKGCDLERNGWVDYTAEVIEEEGKRKDERS